MKAILKGFIIGLVFVAVGLAIIISTLAVNGWSLKSPKFTIETYTSKLDNTSIKIDVGASTLKTEYYDGEKIEISYPVRHGFKYRIGEADGKLSFSSDTKWYATFFTFYDVPETVIKLPKDTIFNLDIEVAAGTVSVSEGVYGNILIDVSAGKLEISGATCDKLDCTVSAGTLNINALTCPLIEADVSAGKLSMNVNGVQSEYSIRTSVSAGSCNLVNQTGTTDKKLSADCSAGSITVTFSN